MKLNNINLKFSNKVDTKINKIIIPLVIHNNKIDLFNYINNIIKTNKNDFSKKIIKDIETRIIKDKKDIVSLNMILQTKETYYELIIIVLKVKPKLNNNELLDKIRILGSDITSNILHNKIQKSNIYLIENEDEMNNCFLEGFLMRFYKFTKYKTKETKELKQFNIIYKQSNTFKKMFGKTLNNLSSLFLAKDLINEPANKLTPTIFIKHITDYIKSNNLKIKSTVLDSDILKKMGMNLIVSVGEGSVKENKSKLLMLYYEGSSKKKSIKKTIFKNIKELDYILIGKGVTFDTGGISLKGDKNLYEMKYDMTGASIVSNFICGYAKNKGKRNILCFVPLAQNNISNKATIPGDIITSYSGKTVEIQNTDAEGRLLLADCLAYVNKHFKTQSKHMKVIDIATLTGQQESISDKYFGSVITRDEKIVKDVIDAGEYTGEKMVYMPYMTEFEEKLKSDTADYKNINEKSKSGILISSAFLGLFIERKFNWIHFDIAGPSFGYHDVKDYSVGEGSAFSLRLLFKMIN